MPPAKKTTEPTPSDDAPVAGADDKGAEPTYREQATGLAERIAEFVAATRDGIDALKVEHRRLCTDVAPGDGDEQAAVYVRRAITSTGDLDNALSSLAGAGSALAQTAAS